MVTEAPLAVKPSEDDLFVAGWLYDAMAEHDAAAILATLRPVVPDLFDVTPVPDELLPGSGPMAVIGRYIGSAQRSGKPLDAAFAHLLRVEEGIIIELIQITDTARWHESLAAQVR